MKPVKYSTMWTKKCWMRKSKEKVFEKEKITEILHQKQLEAKDFYN